MKPSWDPKNISLEKGETQGDEKIGPLLENAQTCRTVIRNWTGYWNFSCHCIHCYEFMMHIQAFNFLSPYLQRNRLIPLIHYISQYISYLNKWIAFLYIFCLLRGPAEHTANCFNLESAMILLGMPNKLEQFKRIYFIEPQVIWVEWELYHCSLGVYQGYTGNEDSAVIIWTIISIA